MSAAPPVSGVRGTRRYVLEDPNATLLAHPLLHRGGCATYPDQVGLISRQDAMVALAEPDIEPCEAG
ncbi:MULTISPECIES: DUF6233 domain-containing protein [Streptomyces]|uniref:DUF6233 domain-containing protein n=1 Tax=Streptomyces TaxID=1883 RepID=UPI003430C8BB